MPARVQLRAKASDSSTEEEDESTYPTRLWPQRHSSSRLPSRLSSAELMPMRLSSFPNPYSADQMSEHSRNPLDITFNMRDCEEIQCQGSCIETASPSLAVVSQNDNCMFKVPLKSNGLQVFVAAKKLTDNFLLVQGERITRCVRVHEQLTQKHIVQTVFNENRRYLQDENFCFFDGKCCQKQFDPNAQVYSDRVAVVKVFQIKTVIYSCIYRCNPFYEKHIRIKGNNSYSLHKLKRKFLHRFCEDQLHSYVDIDCVWFTLNNKLVSENVLRSALSTRFSEKEILEVLSRQTSPPETVNLQLYVHIQPADAIPVWVTLKSDQVKDGKIERLTVISPQISAEDLRLEVARAVEEVPEPLKILVGKKELDSKLDIQQVLRSDPSISVKKKQKITVETQILQEPKTADKPMTVSVRLYPYDYISKIKSGVCGMCQVENENVDLYFRSSYLPDNMTVSESRLRDMDCVTAHVFCRRIRLRVRSTTRRLHDIIVDDAGKTTVGEIKAFMRKTDKSASPCHSPVVAVHNGRVLGDGEVILNTALYPGKTEAETRILVLVQTNTICFSVSSAVKGKLAVFCCTGKGWFHHTLARTDGEDLLTASVDSHTKQKIESLLEMRNRTPSEDICCLDGIRESLHDPLQQNWHVERTTMHMTEMSPSPKLDDRSCETPSASTRHLSSPSVSVDISVENNETVGYVTPTGEKGIDNPPRAKTPVRDVQTSPLVFTFTYGMLPEVTPAKTFSQKPICKKKNSLDGPASPLASPIFRSRAYKSDSESVKTKVSNKYFYSSSTTDRVERKDGCLTIYKSVESIATIPEEVAEKMAARRSQKEGPEGCSSTSVQSLADTSSNIGSSTFKYINPSTVQQVSKELGRDGFHLARSLGVPDSKLDQIKAEHPNDLAEQNYSILRTWCQCKGAEATREALMEGLRHCDRNDLVDTVKETEKSQCNTNSLANVAKETAESESN